MCEGALDQFPALLYPFASTLAPDPSPIRVDRSLFFLLASPAPPSTFRFGASGLLDALIAVIVGQPSGPEEGGY